MHRHKTYDLIFLDIDMPGIDGIETAKKLRQYDDKGKDCICDQLSGFRWTGVLAVHAFSYMVKPLSDKNIHKILEEAYEYYKEEEIHTHRWNLKQHRAASFLIQRIFIILSI